MTVPKNYDDFIFVKHNDTKIEQSKSLFFPKIKKIYKRMHFSLLIDRAEWVSEWEEKTKKEERNSRRMKEISQTSFYSFGALLRSPRKKQKKSLKEMKRSSLDPVWVNVQECEQVHGVEFIPFYSSILSLSTPRDVFLHSYLKKSFCLSEILPFPRKKKIQKYKRRGDKEERMILAWKSAAISY